MMKRNNHKKIFVLITMVLFSTAFLFGQKRVISKNLILVKQEIGLLKFQLRYYSINDSIVETFKYDSLARDLGDQISKLNKLFVSKKRLAKLYQIQRSLYTIASDQVEFKHIYRACNNKTTDSLPQLSLPTRDTINLNTTTINVGTKTVGPWGRTNKQLNLQQEIHQTEIANLKWLAKQDISNWARLKITIDRINKLVDYQTNLNKKQIEIECNRWLSSLKFKAIDQCDDILNQIVSHKYYRK